MRMFLFKFVMLGAAPFLFVSMTAVLARAQFPMAEGRSTVTDRELEERIASMRYLISLAEKGPRRRKVDPKLALEQLQEDFTRLQIVNKDLVLTTSRSDKPDFKFVAKTASEINKRA